MKGGLRETPLPQPEGVLAGQESIAKTVSEPLIERALMIVTRIVLEDMFDVCGIRYEKSVIRASLQMNEVTVSIRSVKECADWIGTELRQDTEERIPARSWRKRT